MKEIETKADGVTVKLSGDDIDLLMNAINETLENVEAWEFSTRTGFGEAEFQRLHEMLSLLRKKMEQPDL